MDKCIVYNCYLPRFTYKWDYIGKKYAPIVRKFVITGQKCRSWVISTLLSGTAYLSLASFHSPTQPQLKLGVTK